MTPPRRDSSWGGVWVPPVKEAAGRKALEQVLSGVFTVQWFGGALKYSDFQAPVTTNEEKRMNL